MDGTTIFLPVTLTAAAAAALINLWLAIRVGQMRGATGLVHGDDAGGPLTRRMRAQLNFVENTGFVLVLIAGIELAGRGGQWLAFVAAAYMLGRLAHGVGMDGETPTLPRRIGTGVTMLTLLGLAIAATLVALRVI
ncbi:MAG: MAPEG family protein [Alphaproteobacteria bacterium]|nr:MAPEG family protein [Alphaproteobacteria bacterium]MBU1755999.1 MAPEG family protein [Alphaproteobacteria bacterium]MBU2032437.1 MAPEG family protein [Alphaproteobacteria bacterium]